jgi:hypothetical protein
MTHELPGASEDASTRTDETAPLGWAVTQTMPYAASPTTGAAAAPASSPADGGVPVASSVPSAGPATGAGEAEGPVGAPHTAPALNPPTWTGRKTAIAAALAIGISSVGAVGAATALPPGTMLGDSGQVQRGGFGGPGGPGGPGGQGGLGGPVQGRQQGQQGAVPGTQGGQVPGGQAPAAPGASTT